MRLPWSVVGLLRRLPPRRLALVAGLLFLITLVVPDGLPFVDEALMGLLTWWLARRTP